MKNLDNGATYHENDEATSQYTYIWRAIQDTLAKEMKNSHSEKQCILV